MDIRKKVAFYTLGCKLNFSETSTIARGFSEEGFDRVSFEQEADIYVINTCSVTDNADKQFRQTVKKAIKLNPDAFVIAIGCYAQLKPEELADVNGVDLVLGASEKFKITDYINSLSKNTVAEVHSCEIENANFYVGSYSIGDRTRAFLKVQDGCDYKCTYCTIPMARGISRSDTLENIVKNVEEIAEGGIKEIVLTGVNIGDFGKGELGNKIHKHTFQDLVEKLDNSVERFRISSIEPNLITNEIIEFVSRSKSFVPHFHIPLQSGSNYILKLMKRRYLREVYQERVSRIKQLMPHACIGVDVIVGFPGETDEHFMETYNFINQLDISYLHVFTYSERPNTEAAEMPEEVPAIVRGKRNKTLRILSVKKRRSFYESHLGTIRTVLFESENKNNYIYGFTDNYIKVKVPFDLNLTNTLQCVKLISIDEDGNVIGSNYPSQANACTANS